MTTSRIFRPALLLIPAFLPACQPQLDSTLPTGQAAYDTLERGEAKPVGVYQLLPGDIVSVQVFQEPDLTQERVTIDQSGNLYLPLIGQVRAAGRGQAEIAREIEQAYAKSYLRAPRVTVVVNETQASTVSVEGEVAQPGVYQIQPGSTLLAAMALARSPTRTAKLDEVLVFRMVNGQRMGARFNLIDIRAGRAGDPQIMAGDVVVVGFNRVQGAYRDILQAAPLFNVFTQF